MCKAMRAAKEINKGNAIGADVAVKAEDGDQPQQSQPQKQQQQKQQQQ